MGRHSELSQLNAAPDCYRLDRPVRAAFLTPGWLYPKGFSVPSDRAPIKRQDALPTFALSFGPWSPFLHPRRLPHGGIGTAVVLPALRHVGQQAGSSSACPVDRAAVAPTLADLRRSVQLYQSRLNLPPPPPSGGAAHAARSQWLVWRWLRL